jgi:hypothetical protein
MATQAAENKYLPPYRHISLGSIGGARGAEVAGVNLSRELAPAAARLSLQAQLD